jgi:hypothetical protein
MRRVLALAAALLALRPALATDPYAFFDWDVSYVTAAPLGVKQQASVLGRYGAHPRCAGLPRLPFHILTGHRSMLIWC